MGAKAERSRKSRDVVSRRRRSASRVQPVKLAGMMSVGDGRRGRCGMHNLSEHKQTRQDEGRANLRVDVANKVGVL
eukprot:1075936-Pleurochrysis_carterae.AAC.1